MKNHWNSTLRQKESKDRAKLSVLKVSWESRPGLPTHGRRGEGGGVAAVSDAWGVRRGGGLLPLASRLLAGLRKWLTVCHASRRGRGRELLGLAA